MGPSPDVQPGVRRGLGASDAPISPLFGQRARGFIAADRIACAVPNRIPRSYPARYRYAKRALDLVLGVAGLMLCAPIIGVLALLVRLDSPGPAFFVQPRVGQFGKLFPIYKLRTMSVPEGSSGMDEADDEARITRVGRYLRRWSLDELPQLVNVIRGDMTLVGPRPERPEIVLARYDAWQYARFDVPQGLTGWWQITSRGRTRLCDDTDADLVYLERASFWFDLVILARTVPAIIRQAGLR